MAKREKPVLPPFRRGKINVLAFNTHVGVATRNGAWRWLKRDLRKRGVRPHIVLVQEDQSRAARLRTRAAFPAPFWRRIGPGMDEEGGTHIYVRRSRFSVAHRTNDLISMRAGRWHPPRRLTAAYVYDRWTRRNVAISCVHTWHIVGQDLAGKSPIVREHVKQMEVVADWHDRFDDNGLVHISGGDWNQNVSAPQPPIGRTPVGIMARAGLVPSYKLTKGKARLDEVFVPRKPWLNVAYRRVIEVPVKGADHPAVLVSLQLEP